jgi:ABC-type Fe3+-siderophore transport system permease subunit
MQFPTLKQMRMPLWVIAAACMAVIFVMIQIVQTNPKHSLAYPETLRINGVVDYMTATQLHIMAAAGGIAFSCIAVFLLITFYLRGWSTNGPER